MGCSPTGYLLSKEVDGKQDHHHIYQCELVALLVCLSQQEKYLSDQHTPATLSVGLSPTPLSLPPFFLFFAFSGNLEPMPTNQLANPGNRPLLSHAAPFSVLSKPSSYRRTRYASFFATVLIWTQLCHLRYTRPSPWLSPRPLNSRGSDSVELYHSFPPRESLSEDIV